MSCGQSCDQSCEPRLKRVPNKQKRHDFVKVRAAGASQSTAQYCIILAHFVAKVCLRLLVLSDTARLLHAGPTEAIASKTLPTKACSNCGKYKPYSSDARHKKFPLTKVVGFNIVNRKGKGLVPDSECKDCVNARARASRALKSGRQVCMVNSLGSLV